MWTCGFLWAAVSLYSRAISPWGILLMTIPFGVTIERPPSFSETPDAAGQEPDPTSEGLRDTEVRVQRRSTLLRCNSPIQNAGRCDSADTTACLAAGHTTDAESAALDGAAHVPSAAFCVALSAVLV